MRGVAHGVGERLLLMKLHEQGQSFSSLSRDTKIPRSVLYRWYSCCVLEMRLLGPVL